MNLYLLNQRRGRQGNLLLGVMLVSSGYVCLSGYQQKIREQRESLVGENHILGDYM